MPIILRVVMFVLLAWGLWRLYLAFYPPGPRPPRPRPRRSVRKQARDEWQDVLEAIDDLPEADEPGARARREEKALPPGRNPAEEAEVQDGIESIMLQEAEMALSMVREGDENERLAAFHEITIYEKLCAMADGHVSAATRQKIDDIHQRALELIEPLEDED